jgi:hypothetical protein
LFYWQNATELLTEKLQRLNVPRGGNPRASIDRSFVGQAFLKKVRTWPHGGMVEPVDLDERSPIRRQCSEDVLGRSVEAVKSYWQQMIFSGRDLPPPEVESDDAVVSFVARRAGALGYVSAGANLRGTKILTLE